MDARPAERVVLTRFAILRLLGIVYTFAFLALALQVVALVGHDGLLPADAYLDRLRAAGYGPTRAPTIFWWIGAGDGLLRGLAWLGVALGGLCAAGLTNAVALFVLWLLYLSFLHIGQVWMGYGWDILLCETGFLAIFLAPLVDVRPIPKRAPPRVVVWLFRWLVVRVMLGAGLIKIRGDACWRELTCLDWHFETQPLPNPLSPLFHSAPHWVHAAGVVFNHVAELGVPLFAVVPSRRLRRIAGAVMLAFQVTLILSGNLSFLNYLTIVPILACFDDGVWARLLGRTLAARAEAAEPPTRAARAVAWTVAALVAFLSIDVVRNLVSSEQRMNASFEPLELVNTYGAFGSVGRTRDEIVFEGTRDETPGDRWTEYEFPCKPGDPARAPCWVAPYQPRLDWQIWFAAMGSPADEPWTVHLVWKLLHGDRATLGLLAGDPFPDGPPRWIRARLYRYELVPWGEPGWWKRRLVGEWLPPLSADTPALREAVESMGWR